ncbi:protein of unknown function [Microbacterium sp. Nx66]|nr:protein of unknown function [Microbacterium sp. Nx66]
MLRGLHEKARFTHKRVIRWS